MIDSTSLYESEVDANKKLNYLLNNKRRVFQLLITDDSDDSYIPDLECDYILCDCSINEDFTSGKTWQKYFDEYEDKTVVFINTSNMFEQFKLKANNENSIHKNISGAAIWAQYMYYRYRDKMFNEQRTKFIFSVTEKVYIDMISYVDCGFSLELIPIYI